MEDVLAALDSKNPSIKAETCLFLARSFRISSASSLPKAVLKPLGSSLVQVNVQIIYLHKKVGLVLANELQPHY